jgi:hypothetical protein
MDVSASSLGKYKTGFQIAAIIPLMFHYPAFGLDFHAIGMVFLWCALVLDAVVWNGLFFAVQKIAAWINFSVDMKAKFFIKVLFQLSGNNSVVECDLAKVEVAGSNPVSRSIFIYRGGIAKW